MPEQTFYPRLIEPRLAEALEDSPVVLIHGPRQCGKTTLAQYAYVPSHCRWGDDHLRREEDQRDYGYISFDDAVARDGARADPAGFVADLPERVILDEIQLVPELFPVLKLEVDRNRVPGRFILAGSTNVLLLPALSESLAGRLQIVRLHPLSRYELASRSTVAAPNPGRGFVADLFGEGFKIGQTRRLGSRLAELIVAGGFPPALARPTPRRQANWYRDYVETLVQRDVRDLPASDRSRPCRPSCAPQPRRRRGSSTSPIWPRRSNSAVPRSGSTSRFSNACSFSRDSRPGTAIV